MAAVQYATAEIDPPRPLATLSLGGAGKKWPAAEVPALLEAVCRQVLQRGTDPLIEASFAEGLKAGTATVRDVVFSLSLTDLYTEKFGAPGRPREAVEHAYRRLLAREVEPAGLGYWAPICERQGLAQVLRGHATSGEYVNRFGNDRVPFPPPAAAAHESLFMKVVRTAVKVGGQIVAVKVAPKKS